MEATACGEPEAWCGVRRSAWRRRLYLLALRLTRPALTLDLIAISSIADTVLTLGKKKMREDEEEAADQWAPYVHECEGEEKGGNLVHTDIQYPLYV